MSYFNETIFHFNEIKCVCTKFMSLRRDRYMKRVSYTGMLDMIMHDGYDHMYTIDVQWKQHFTTAMSRKCFGNYFMVKMDSQFNKTTSDVFPTIYHLCKLFFKCFLKKYDKNELWHLKHGSLYKSFKFCNHGNILS